MNRNFTAFCAAMLAFAIMLVLYGGLLAKNENFSIAETDDKCVYLTFDDGPSDRVTPKILDVLKEENVKATFFIIGKQAEPRKYILKRQFDEGHTVAVHSYTHKYKEIYSSTESLLKDIDLCNEVIKSVTGSYSRLYRFPGGSFGLSSDIIKAVTDRGMTYIDWNASTCDAEFLDPTPDAILNAAVTTVANPKKIVLLAHDSTDKSATAEALKEIIRHYKNEGYVFKAF